jgi:tetratricopeptide (TPR) repeat protein
MTPEFTAIVQKLIAEQGRDTLLNAAKCKALLADYTRGEYKKESRLLLQAIEAGVAQAIDGTDELDLCKQRQTRLLQEDYYLAPEMAADVVDMLGLVLRGDTSCAKKNVSASVNSQAQRTSTKSAEKLNDECNQYVSNKDYDTAIEKFSEAIAQYPNYHRFYCGRGNAYANKKQWDLAIEDYTKSIKIEPNYFWGYYHRGHTYFDTGDYNRAIQDCTNAIELDPQHALVYAIHGLAYNQIGQKQKAIQDLEKAVSLDPNNQWVKDRLKEIRGW